jgi:hypothetical protein
MENFNFLKELISNLEFAMRERKYFLAEKLTADIMAICDRIDTAVALKNYVA